MNNTQQIWDILARNSIVSGEKPENDAELIPWYIRFIQGFAGWIAAFFFLGFFAVAFNFMFKSPTADIMLTVGILCSVASYAIIRMQKNDFFEQVGMAFSLCGQLMFAVGLFYMKFKFSTAMFVLGTYQLFLAHMIPQYAHRLLTTCFGLLAILLALNYIGLHGLGSAFLAVVFSFIWIKETSWQKKYDYWEAIGYGVTITIIISSGVLLFGKFLLREAIRMKSGWLFEHAGLINSLLIALIFVNLVIVLLKENKVPVISKSGILSLIAAAGLVIISFRIGGISTGLLVTLIGFARQRIVLIILGWFTVISFFSWYYYNLEETLLVKSVVLIVLGFLMSVAYIMLQRTYNPESRKKLNNISLSKWNNNHLVAVLTVIIVLVMTNINISKKQDLISNGENLYLKLAPVDPRSLMQGDYMRLRFELGDKIRERLQLINNNRTIPKTNGIAVIEKDKNNIGTFVSLFNNQNLTANQFLIHYKYRDFQVYFTTDAFYFQEGKASHYQKSEFGLYKINKQGEMILVNMADKNLKIL